MRGIKSATLATLAVAVIVGGLTGPASAQMAPPWDLSVYQAYFEQHADLTAEGLLTEYESGAFAETAPSNFDAATFGPELKALYELTPDEIALIARHGFVVSERLSYPSFGEAFLDIFVQDMPVYVSSDAILHALHMSYDDILQDIEWSILIPSLTQMLTDLHATLPALADKYAGEPGLDTMLMDLDVYLTMPRILLGGQVEPVYAANQETVAILLDAIKNEKPASIPLFAENKRDIDFSQFTPRGHYTDDPYLTKYFQAMIWLGRTELYLIAPQNTFGGPSKADVRRQIILTRLLTELVDASGVDGDLNTFDLILRTMVGESDNVTLENVREVYGELDIQTAAELLDTTQVKAFQDDLATKPYAFQRILSQILYRDPSSSEPVEPAAAFLLLGQRFIIDSYVTASVVYDKIPAFRMMPSTLDILFALGNDAAAQFLKEELETYGYAPELASLRHLIDSYDERFWTSSMYNGWLNAIRQLAPPDSREALPPFMQTAAWWQKSMSTQLASWSQLRHDNLLYAKQSYTTGVICLFPESYVEPVPRFFGAVRAYAARAAQQIQTVIPDRNSSTQSLKARMISYFNNLAETAGTLAAIAQKELAGTPITDNERAFLGDMMMDMQAYAYRYVDGWYPKLFYNEYNEFSESYFTGRIFQKDYVVADVHTQPTDEFGSPVGKVLHAGTGPVNLALIVAELQDGHSYAFVGPVLSYYEYTTLNFKRLTDEEWDAMYDDSPPLRPAFANLYLVDKNGEPMPAGPSLATGVERDPAAEIPISSELSVQNYPNPFREGTVIGFSVPQASGIQPVTVLVYNTAGQLVATLVDEPLAPGHYSTRWDGTVSNGGQAPSGSYSYVLTVGDNRRAGVMVRIR